MAEDKVFLDTNIIIYAYDATAGEKHRIARDILVDLWNSGRGLLSAQVLQEFFVTVTRKIQNPIGPELAGDIIDGFLKWDTVSITAESVADAIGIHLRYKYSFWDSMIVEASIRGGAALLLTEDFSGGQKIGDLRIKNPFK